MKSHTLTPRQLAAVKAIAAGWTIAAAAAQLHVKNRCVQKLLCEAGQRLGGVPAERHLLVYLARWYWLEGQCVLRPLRRPRRAPTVPSREQR